MVDGVNATVDVCVRHALSECDIDVAAQVVGGLWAHVFGVFDLAWAGCVCPWMAIKIWRAFFQNVVPMIEEVPVWDAVCGPQA